MNEREHIVRVINDAIRPFALSNGSVELDRISSEGNAIVRLSSVLLTCPGKQETIKDVIRTTMHNEFPALAEVIFEHQVSDALINQALSILRNRKC